MDIPQYTKEELDDALRVAHIILDKTKDSIEVFDDRVLVEPDPQDTMTKAGLFIPDDAKEPQVTGIAVKKGKNCKETKVPSRVMFGKHAGAFIKVRNKSYLIMRESDIVAEL